METRASTEELVGRRPAHYDAHAAATAGLEAGLVGGAVLAALRAGLAVLGGGSATADFRRIAQLLVGSAPVAADPLPSLALGAIAHFSIALVFGLAFGLAAFGLQRATVLWASLVYGFVVYGLMAFVVLPAVAPPLVLAEVGLGEPILHAIFGFAVGACFESLRFRGVARAGARHPGRTLTIVPGGQTPRPA